MTISKSGGETKVDDRQKWWQGAPLSALLYINVRRFRFGLVFKARRLLYRSTLGLRVIKKEKDLVVQAVGVAVHILLLYYSQA